MAKPLKNPHDLPFSRIESRFDLASMQLSSLSKFQPAVFKKSEGNGYGIRILRSSSYNNFSGTRRTSWEYFYTDDTGLITESPRGLASEYNGRYRVSGLEEAVEAYKDKRINHN
jgi:hypothetical protein